jgi:LPS O-antigen subunit length determinant protein (WzzB/FepE family)
MLKEAAGIAHSLDIKDPIAYKLKKISDSAMTNSQILTGISSNAPQIYTRGYEAIEAEIASLSNRKVDDPFIPELRGLQEKLKLLEHNRKIEQLKSRQNDDPFIKSLRDKENELARLASIDIDPATVKTARLDQAAFPPDKRIKPKRKLIVVLGFMLGLMLGVFAAFFVNFIENQREEKAEA